MKKIFIALLVTICSLPALAQNAEYTQMAKEIDEENWTDKDPAFENNKLPAAYKNESAVILARKQTVETNTERKGRSMLYIGKMHSTIKRTFRERIFINDQVSLDAYSEVNFNQLQSKENGALSRLRTYTFMGIRVTKADGSLQKINVDEAAVKLDETKNGKKNKIAVPNLAIGDIIDYYITYFEQARTDKSVDYFNFVLGDEYPIVNLGIKVLLDKRVAAQYQVINGAPDFKITKADDDNLLELTASDLPKSTNVTWVSESRQVPMVRMKYAFADIIHGRGDYTKIGKIEKVTSPEDVEHEFVNIIKPFLVQLPVVGNVKREWKDYAKEHKIDVEDIDSLLSFVYYHYRNDKYGRLFDNLIIDTDVDRFLECSKSLPKIKQIELILNIMKTINSVFDVEAELVLISTSEDVNYKDIFSVADFNFMLRIPKPGSKFAFYYFGNNLYNFGEIPPVFENETYKFIQQKTIFKGGRDMGQDKADKLNGKDVTFKTSVTHNFQTDELVIKPDSANMQLLNIKRQCTAGGHLRREMQSRVLILEDYLRAEAKLQGRDADPLKQLEYANKGYKKTLESAGESMVTAKEKQKEKFEKEIASEYRDKPKELKSYAILQGGFSGTNASMSIEEEFSMDGWVKKAGNNYIIEAGKFAGGQLEIKADQRERKLDIYLPYSRSFTKKIIFKIPEGYNVEGIEKLNKSIKNECGGFESTAKIEGSDLLITFSKYYSNNFEPASNWSKITAFVDAGFAFTKEKILLKKK